MDAAGAERACHIQERVAGRLGANRYRTWFGESTEFQLHDDRLDVMVSNRFVGSWIVSNYLPALSAAAREVVGTEIPVDVRVKDGGQTSSAETDSPARPPGPSVRAASAAPRKPGPSRPALRGTFDSFVVGPCNRLAYSAACSVVETPGATFRPLVVHGGCGLGKTHLLQAICNGVGQAHPTLEWRYVSGEEFTNEFIYAVKAGRIDLFRARFRSVDLLVIDDIHFLANKKATQEEFLHTFNAIDACGRAVVLTSDRHPRSIATLSEPLINRLISGMVVHIDPPQYCTRREILRRRAQQMNQPIGDAVLDFVARRITRNVRELEGALYKLAALASLTKGAIDVELARRALEDHISHAHGAVEAADIVRVVAGRFGVTGEQIRSKSRERTVCLARAIAMYLIREHTNMSFPEIGRAMGNKNHSTSLMATQRIRETLKRDGTVAWRAASGCQEASLRELLDDLGERLSAHKARTHT